MGDSDHDNHEVPFYMGESAEHRVTKLANVGLEAMKESPYYLADDKLALLITNDVTKSDWDHSECGMGFWNFENPRDVFNTMMNHIMSLAQGYGIEMTVMEASVMEVKMPPDPLGNAIQRAMNELMRKMHEQENRNAEGL